MSDSIKSEDHYDAIDNTKLQLPWYLAWIYTLDKFGIEDRGIHRVPGNERDTGSTWKRFLTVLGFWFAGCGSLTTMSSFFLPTLMFSLNMKQSMIAGLIGMNLGNLVPAYCSTLGPQSGCRWVVTARFLFGYWGVRVIALITIIGGIGWSVVNCVLGGQILAALGNVDLYAGILVISLSSLIIGIFGIGILMKFQCILAIPANISFLLYYIVVCRKTGHISEANALVADMGLSTLTQTGNFLSWFTIAYSVTATWGGCAADYYIFFPQETPKWQAFLVTFLGIAIPSNFTAIVSMLAGTIAFSYEPWTDAYNENGVGGLLVIAFKEWGGFGKFVVVVMFLSLICNTNINTYSSAFLYQIISSYLLYVPRWVWTVVSAVIYLVLSLAGKEHLSEILSNFLPMLGYWISMYIIMLLEENLIFRNQWTKHLHSVEFQEEDVSSESSFNKEHDELYKPPSEVVEATSVGSWEPQYNWVNWNDQRHMTMGLACCASFLVGVVGAVLGMNQVYFIGPLAKKIGEYGGDIGMWLCMGFSGVVYPPLRYLELKRFHR